MATQKPRFSVVAEPETYQLLQRLSHAGGGSVSSIVRELLESARPVLERMVLAAENWQHLDATKQAEILAQLESAEAQITPDALRIQAETLRAFDEASDK